MTTTKATALSVMNATNTNLTKEFPNNHSDANSNAANVVAHSSAIVAATMLPSSRRSRCSSTLSLESSAPASSQRPLVATTIKTTTTANQECSRSEAQNASAGKELSAVAYEDTTKLISTAIKFININKISSSNSNSNKSSNTSSDKQRTNSPNYGGNSNSNKSTSKSTATDDVAKSASSKFINSRNKLTTTTTHARQEEPQQQQQEQIQQRQQAEQIVCAKRHHNQINLKSSLYADQQPFNDNNNANNSNRHNNQQNDDTQNKLHVNVSSNNESYINNNNLNNANNNNNNKKTSQQLKEPPRAASATPTNNNGNNKNNKSDSNEWKVNNSDDESNELGAQQPRPQQLISAIRTAFIQPTTKVTIANELEAAAKVRAEKFGAAATTTAATIKAPAIERAKAATLTLRKSFSMPASFKIGEFECAGKRNNNNKNGQTVIKANNNNSSSIKLLINANKMKQEEEEVNKKAMRRNKDDGYDGGGDDGDGGGGGAAYDSGRGNCTKPVATIIKTTANLAAVMTKVKLANNSIEATIATTTAKTIACTLTNKSSATMDAAMRSASQQQQQQSHTKTLKAKDNESQVICGSYSVAAVGGENDAVVVASTTTAASSSLPLPAAVSFDLDLRFGCAHYKRRAMFVTPCCNNFYKCRFCHDENESHHFDRKTLTELICSECNMRQKVQEQCEACGTRFGKYTCLICNLFDDTDKKQYHCNGCGICRIGGAENFFHCEVCDMCLPIRLKIDGHRCVENISRSHCPVCLGDIHTSRIPCHIPDCGHLLHKTCFDQLLNSGHYTCPICQTSLIDMTALWEYLDAQAVSLPVPKKYENQRIHIFCNDCHKTSKTKFNFIGLKCMQCGAYNTTQDVKRRMSLVTDEPSSA